MGKHSKLTTEEIIEMAGFSLVAVEGDCYSMTCTNGHSLIYTEQSIRGGKVMCNICSGRGMDLPKARKELVEYGYTLVDAKLSVDRCGNEVLKAAQRITVRCQQGHETSAFCMSDIRAGRTCTYCSGSVRNSSYSRSEEIIAKVLDLNNIKYERQYPITTTHDGEVYTLRIDFFLADLNTILEYDGMQHKYGRSDQSIDSLQDTKLRDQLRDDYARTHSIDMLRIDGEMYYGKSLVFWLHEHLGTKLNSDINTLYDEMVMGIIDHSAQEFGWNTYNHYKEIADMRLLGQSLTDLYNDLGIRPTKANKSFRMVYGVSFKDYTLGKYSKFV